MGRRVSRLCLSLKRKIGVRSVDVIMSWDEEMLSARYKKWTKEWIDQVGRKHRLGDNSANLSNCGGTCPERSEEPSQLTTKTTQVWKVAKELCYTFLEEKRGLREWAGRQSLHCFILQEKSSKPQHHPAFSHWTSVTKSNQTKNKTKTERSKI